MNCSYNKIKSFHNFSLKSQDEFWLEQSNSISWYKSPKTGLDFSTPPFARWFPDGKTNLCFNAIDRHLKLRGDQDALIYISKEVNKEKKYSYNELHKNVVYFSKLLIDIGIQKGDRVIIYMPMIPEALFSILACARLGAIHSVVFGGFASNPLSVRINDAKPKLLITTDAGIRNGKKIPYKEIVDSACEISLTPPANTLIVDRKLIPIKINQKNDILFSWNYNFKKEHSADCEELNSTDVSYILYTSGTTGIPKGIQRDVGGYAVALASSMKYIYDCKPGEVFFCASDIGWVVGHSYLVYAPLINGSTTILFEGLPTIPDASVWWSIVEKYKVTTMFTSPTAIRVLKKQNQMFLQKHDTSSLRKLFLAGEPLDSATNTWISSSLKKTKIIDNYWQTETGWPILSAQFGIDESNLKLGSPSFPVYGYDVQLSKNNKINKEKENSKGMLCIATPLPPGCLQTIWENNTRFVETYFTKSNSTYYYNTFDYAECDNDGYFFILGRTDDVINVAGHRIGTREIEEAIQHHEMVAETAVVGINNELKGQLPIAFVVKKNEEKFLTKEIGLNCEIEEIKSLVTKKLGAFARPEKIYFVNSLPKTRSGKLLRRAIQALIEDKNPGDLTTLEDPSSLEEIKKSLKF